MALKSEFILTLQQLKGIGAKTILDIANNIDYNVETVDDLCKMWQSLKGKKFEKINSEDIYLANRNALKIIEASKNDGIGILAYYDNDFPAILKRCVNEEGKDDPVILLYYRGNLKALVKPGIAIIGTREPTENGIIAGKHFAKEFAKENFNIVSGLAIGCDTTAHQGALSANGTTTAFLANGLDWDSIYPKENLELAKQIVKNGGLLLSEYPIGQNCNRYALVARDRLQSALSYATIAIQTGIKGGTMHAVNTTIVSRKPLFMVEYKMEVDYNHDKVQGNNKLILEKKAHPLRSDNIRDAISIIDSYIDQSKNTVVSKTSLF